MRVPIVLVNLFSSTTTFIRSQFRIAQQFAHVEFLSFPSEESFFWGVPLHSAHYLVPTSASGSIQSRRTKKKIQSQRRAIVEIRKILHLQNRNLSTIGIMKLICHHVRLPQLLLSSSRNHWQLCVCFSGLGTVPKININDRLKK